jgi:hypothetical protein
MDYRKYVRDAAKVHSVLRELDGDRLVTTKGCKIVVPVRFAERGLAYVGIETSIVGIFAIIVEDQYYAVSIANAMMRITPSSTTKVMYDDDEYYEFTFDPGATICPSLQLVKIDTLVYSIYDEILSKGRAPWYLGYKELGQLFDTAQEHAGANVGQQQEVTELMVSLVARDPEDRTKYYRQVIQSDQDLVNKKPAIIPLRSVAYAATNTLNKLAGSYARDGLVSALATPTARVERLEDLLRK